MINTWRRRERSLETLNSMNATEITCVSCFTFLPCFVCATHMERSPWAVSCNFCWGPCLPGSSGNCPLSHHLDSALAPPTAEQIGLRKKRLIARYSITTYRKVQNNGLLNHLWVIIHIYLYNKLGPIDHNGCAERTWENKCEVLHLKNKSVPE